MIDFASDLALAAWLNNQETKRALFKLEELRVKKLKIALLNSKNVNYPLEQLRILLVEVNNIDEICQILTVDKKE